MDGNDGGEKINFFLIFLKGGDTTTPPLYVPSAKFLIFSSLDHVPQGLQGFFLRIQSMRVYASVCECVQNEKIALNSCMPRVKSYFL